MCSAFQPSELFSASRCRCCLRRRCLGWLGLGIPFFAAAVGLNWYLARTRVMRSWLPHIERVAGGILILLGGLLFTGKFSTLAGYFAGFGQLFEL